MDHKKIYLILTGYFAAYVISFGSIIDKGLFTLEFMIFLITSCIIVLASFRVSKIRSFIQLTKGSILGRLVLTLVTLSLHAYSGIMGQILGPTEIQSTVKGFLETSVTTNVFLVKVNALVLSISLLVSLIIGFIVDKKITPNKVSLKLHVLQLLFTVGIISANFILLPFISVLLLLLQLGRGL